MNIVTRGRSQNYGILASEAVTVPKKIYNIGWFITLVVAGVLISYFLDVLLNIDLPIQPAIRVLLFLQFALLFIFPRQVSYSLPKATVYSLVVFFVSIFTSFILALLTSPDTAIRTFIFMHGISFFLIFFITFPLYMRPGVELQCILIGCLAFGLWQVLAQDLSFSEQLREKLGLQFDFFVNGRVRITGLFASKARFGEAATFTLAVVYWQFLKGRRPVLQLLLIGVIIWLIYNSYSRAGYVLAFVTLLIMTAMGWFYLKSRVQKKKLLYLSSIELTVIVTVLTVWLFSQDSNLEVLDLNSLQARFSHWANLSSIADRFSLGEHLLGSGRAALYSRSEASYFVIDNVFVSMYLYGGLFGLISFCLLAISIVYAGKVYDPFGNLIPLRAFTMALFIEGFFLDNHNTIFLALISILAMIGTSRVRNEN